MPIIEMHLMVGRSVEQKRAVAEAVAEAVTRTLGVGPEQVRLLITEHGSEEFSVGGVTAGRKQEQAAQEPSFAQIVAHGSSLRRAMVSARRSAVSSRCG